MFSSNDMVAHLWANQSKPRARSSNGNFSFDGHVLYSYSTPIAVIHPEAVLVTNKRYSVTTQGKHKSALWRALDYGQKQKCFTVPYIGAYGGINHRENIRALNHCYVEAVDKLSRSQTNADLYRRQARESVETINDYIDTFRLDVPHHNLHALELTAAALAERIARNNTPERIAKRAKAQAQREAAKVRKLEALAKLEAEKAKAWIDGADVYYRTPYGMPAFLRVKGDTLQTSQGAEVPLEHAKHAFRFILAARERGEPWEANGHRIAVGHFEVNSIDAQGNIRAGCHQIRWYEIERIATQLGMI